jgi:uncharacterized protein
MKARVPVRKGQHPGKIGPEDGAAAPSIFARAKEIYNRSPGARDFTRAFNLLKQVAEADIPEAHEWLGFVYHSGLGTPPNRRLAFKHYQIAANARQCNAEYHLGNFYYEGIGVRRDRALAPLWIRRAARHGSMTAVLWLGCRHLAADGHRLKKKGFELILRAANGGEIQAQYVIGVCYERGEGVTVDEQSAFKWYLRAAKRGYPYAAEALGRLYETGGGVRMSKHKAAFWYGRAGKSMQKTGN